MANKATIYIAGSSAELERVDAATLRAFRIGLVVIGNWPDAVRLARAEGRGDADLDVSERAQAARFCTEAISNAEAFLLLAPRAPSLGAWVELGYAAGLQRYGVGPRIVVSLGGLGLSAMPTVFTGLADLLAEDDGAALAHIAGAAGL